MALRVILKYPDKRLRVAGKDVVELDAELQVLIDDMAETMYAAPGVGLAATQTGVPLRVFVIDLQQGEGGQNGLQTFINPVILERKDEVVWEEGCLSFPGVHEDIHRDGWVRARALDRRGQPFELTTEGLFAVAIQHEIDHLDGVLLVDRVSLLKRRLIHRKMIKLRESQHETSQSEESPAPGRPAL